MKRLSMADQGKFTALLREHGALVTRIAASYEADRELARDLTQEILLAVWRALPTFRNESSWRTFIARIAHNRAIAHVTRAANSPKSIEIPSDLACPQPQPESILLEQDRGLRVMMAVQRLPIAYRQVASLILENFTLSEIAQILGLTVNAVTIRSTRARSMLRTLLGE